MALNAQNYEVLKPKEIPFPGLESSFLGHTLVFGIPKGLSHPVIVV